MWLKSERDPSAVDMQKAQNITQQAGLDRVQVKLLLQPQVLNLFQYDLKHSRNR